MRVKEERTDQPGTFFNIFRETYWNASKYKDFMWDPITDMSLNPTLGSMRGKIVILQDFARWQCETPKDAKERASKAEFGLCYNSFDRQDEFQSQPLYTKWLKVKNYLDRANQEFEADPHKDTKFINYLSATGASANTLGIPGPYFVVSGHVAPGRTDSNRMLTSLRLPTNQWPDFPRIRDHRGTERIFYEGTNTLVYDYIRNRQFTKRVGIIMTDFPGGGLIERIICINYSKTDPLCQRLPK
jgi:1-phosphatidylinositol phosphodiesterase